jgi:hypothetical protein
MRGELGLKIEAVGLSRLAVTGRWYKCDGLDGSITVSICWRYNCDGLVVATG